MKKGVSKFFLAAFVAFFFAACTVSVSPDDGDDAFSSSSVKKVSSSSVVKSSSSEKKSSSSVAKSSSSEKNSSSSVAESSSANKKSIYEAVEESGLYTTKDSVAAFLCKFDKLPANYVGKNAGKKLYESETGNTFSKWNFNPWTTIGVMIGGDNFDNYASHPNNYHATLPEGSYHEADVDYSGKNRGTKRGSYRGRFPRETQGPFWEIKVTFLLRDLGRLTRLFLKTV